jgi:4'-phosphopantetheinyl transferase EntD
MFAQLLPEPVRLAKAAPWMWETPALPAEEAHILRAVPKRQREYRAGRHCARQVLAQLGQNGFALCPGKGREPLWPAGIVGSITHSHEACYVAATHHGGVIGIGIDLERRTDTDTDIERLICTPTERAWLEAQQPEPLRRQELMRLMFSAKECIHKVYYPLNAYTLDFLDAEIDLSVTTGQFSGRILNPAAVEAYPLRQVQGQLTWDEEFLYTVIVLHR